jgi:hypothetical protein
MGDMTTVPFIIVGIVFAVLVVLMVILKVVMGALYKLSKKFEE